MQFTGSRAITDPTILYYSELNKVLAVFQWIISQFDK